MSLLKSSISQARPEGQPDQTQKERTSTSYLQGKCRKQFLAILNLSHEVTLENAPGYSGSKSLNKK